MHYNFFQLVNTLASLHQLLLPWLSKESIRRGGGGARGAEVGEEGRKE